MVDQSRRVIRGETVENLHGHETSHLRGKENLGPVGAAPCVDYNLVPFLEPGRLPAKHEFLDIRRELPVGDTAAIIVVKGRLVPALLY